MTKKEREHLLAWMKQQEDINKELAQQIDRTAKALIHLMEYVGVIDNRPPTAEEEEWARRLVQEGCHREPSKPVVWSDDKGRERLRYEDPPK